MRFVLSWVGWKGADMVSAVEGNAIEGREEFIWGAGDREDGEEQGAE